MTEIEQDVAILKKLIEWAACKDSKINSDDLFYYFIEANPDRIERLVKTYESTLNFCAGYISGSKEFHD